MGGGELCMVNICFTGREGDKSIGEKGDPEGGRRREGRDTTVMSKQCGGVMPSFLSTVNGRISAAVCVS